jgi:hypothetical protein
MTLSHLCTSWLLKYLLYNISTSFSLYILPQPAPVHELGSSTDYSARSVSQGSVKQLAAVLYCNFDVDSEWGFVSVKVSCIIYERCPGLPVVLFSFRMYIPQLSPISPARKQREIQNVYWVINKLEDKRTQV